jgi:hypothetical protein
VKTIPVTAGLALTLAACTTAPTSAPTTAPPAVPAPTAAPSPSPTVTAHGCTAWQARPNSVDTIDYARTVLHSTALVTVSSVLVGFYQDGLQVGSEQMNPQGQGTAGTQMVLAPGPASVTLISDDIYISGKLTPNCKVLQVNFVTGTTQP